MTSELLAVVENVAAVAVDLLVEVPSVGVIKASASTPSFLLNREEPLLFAAFLAYRYVRWLSLMAFDPAQHDCPIRIRGIEPQYPFAFCDADRQRRGYPVLIKKDGTLAHDLFITARGYFQVVVLFVER